MDRREFLRTAALSGLAIASPWSLRRAHAAEPYGGTFYVMVDASGGWDPTSLCDPKGTLASEVDVPDANPMNRSYLASDIASVAGGAIRYAPVGGNQAFFEKYADRVLVINGIDTATNGHDSGSRHVWSGKLGEGHPAFAALVAAATAREQPLAFITNGGYDLTQGLVAPTRSGGTGPLTRLAFPNRSDVNNADSRMLSDATFAAVQQAQVQRLERQQQKLRLPRTQQALSTLYTARLGQGDIQRLTDNLPAQLDQSGNPLRRQAQLALAAYKAGLSASANLSLGGFDTHGQHDQNQIPALQRLLEGVDFLMEEAARLEVADRVVVMVGSDFGRTPGYNATNGKDHWSITSVMVMGGGIRGGRTIGGSDERHRALKVNPSTLQLDPSGVTLTPGHVHQALRRLAGVHETEQARAFPISGNELQLFA